MTDSPDLTNRALRMAHFFHGTYEELAASFGYETREETRAFDAMSPNGQLMQAVCAAWLEQRDARIRELEAATSLAYGWLWHVITDDSRVHTARSELLSVIDRSAQSGGIQSAKDAGAVVTIGRNHE